MGPGNAAPPGLPLTGTRHHLDAVPQQSSANLQPIFTQSHSTHRNITGVMTQPPSRADSCTLVMGIIPHLRPGDNASVQVRWGFYATSKEDTAWVPR